MNSKEIKAELRRYSDFAMAYGYAIEELERLEALIRKITKLIRRTSEDKNN